MAKKRNDGAPRLRLDSALPPLPTAARPLFLPDLVRQAATSMQGETPERIRAQVVFTKWAADLKAGVLHARNEGQVEQNFYSGLLDALGYKTSAGVETGQPWTMQPKLYLPGIGTPDVALGTFRVGADGHLDSKALVVVEVERAGKDLDRKESSSGRSPVQQAWDYLNGSESARWAIVSNYVEVRLYSKARTSRHLHRIALADLADPDTFAEFYAVFHAGSLLGTGTLSLNVDKLLEETGERQEKVSEELYKHYSTCRAALIQEFQAKGVADLDTAIRAAQRLLDRILFIAFAEDRGLLGDSRTLEKTAEFSFPGTTPYNSFQFLFKALDRGDPYHRIPKYNGNLFKPDPLLDNIEFALDSERWPQAFKTLGSFDFKHEVTVDVLGRIFERSITDIEQIKAEGLERHEAALAERRKPGRRKTQGVYYTDAAIVDYLVAAALGPCWDRSRAEVAAATGLDVAALPDPPPAAFSRGMLAKLDATTVCDPACGSGAFLNAAYDWFEDARLGLLRDLADAEPGAPECAGDRDDWAARSAPILLRNNLFGVDLSPESVEIAQLSLWIRTARRNQLLTDLSANVLCGNSVVSDPALDPKAFDWPARFPAMAAAGGFDAIVGNPPYVRQEHLGAIKPHLEASYRAYHGMADLYVYFYEQGMRLLKPGGRLAYVVTNKWLKAGYGEPLRRYFAEEAWVESVVDFGHAKQFFKDADVFPCFLVARRPNDEPKPETARVCVIPRTLIRMDELRVQIREESVEISSDRLGSEGWQLESKMVMDLMDRIRGRGIRLGDFVGSKPANGFKTGFNDAFVVSSKVRNQLVNEDPNSASLLKPFLRGRDIKRWAPEWAGQWVIFARRGIDIHAFPAIQRHLAAYRDRLEPKPRDWSGGDWVGRKAGTYQWYELQDSVDYWEEFDRPKIVYKEIQYHPSFAADTEGTYSNNKTFFINILDLYLLSVLNSPLMWCYNWRNLPHMKDDALFMVGEHLIASPIAQPDDTVRSGVELAASRLIEITKQQQTTRRDLLDWLKVQYEVAEPSQKLQSPIGLDSDALVAEVQKVRGKAHPLSSAGLRALRDEHARSIEPARARAAEAAALERRVSDLVNEAYGLTPEEVRLMWETAPPRMPIAPPGA